MTVMPRRSAVTPRSGASRPSDRARVLGTALALLASVGAAYAQDRPLGPVPVPAENQITESKRVLGKILFFDEQLSSDDTVACGTCHVMSIAGADPRRAPAAGADGVLGTADDPLGSPGVVAQDASEDFLPNAAFGLGVQVTGRAASPAVMAMYADDIFWDGRATSTFRDPVSGSVVIASGGALESQAVGPPTSGVEMAHADRDWAQIAAKLAGRRPLGLADTLPTDVAAALASGPSYADLFADAFGDDAITASRIAMAIATYERTLLADQTDWDRFVDGYANALTAAEQRGLGALRGSHCLDCHVPPVFSDGAFRNIGVRPVAEDRGRAEISGSDGDRGKFKVPSLRNAALKRSFFHDGRRTTLQQVLGFYANAPGETQFTENQDPIMAQVRVPPPAAADIVAFLQGGLVDERVRNETFPFDRPRLSGERTERRARVVANGRAGSAGVPVMVAPVPAFSGNADFRVGLERAANGGSAVLAISRTAPVNGEVRQDDVVGPISIASGATGGYATARLSLVDALGGDLYVQWRVQDASAAGGVALSPAVAVTVFALRGETIETYVPGDGGGDGGDPEDVTPVADDATLHVDRATFRIDHAAHADAAPSDRLDLRGALNPRGADSDPSGALVSLEIGGVEIVSPTALDARGRADVTADSRRVKIALDVTSGEFRIVLKNADLRAAIGLDGTAGEGRISRTVALRVQQLGLADETCDTEIEFDWRTRRDRTSGRHDYASDGAESGVFRTTRLRTKDRSAGRHRVKIAALLDDAGDNTVDVSGGLTLVIGTADPIALAAGDLRVAGNGKVRISGNGTAVRRLALDPKRRTLTVDVDDIVAGLPLFPTNGDVSDLTIRVIAGSPSDPDARIFETTVEVARKGQGWRR